NKRQILAELAAIEVVEHAAMAHLLLGHLVEYLGRGGIVLPQALGEPAIDPAVLLLVGDGAGEDFPLGKLGKTLQGGPLGWTSHRYIGTILDRKAENPLWLSGAT